MTDSQMEDSITFNKRKTISYLSNWWALRPPESQLVERGVLTTTTHPPPVEGFRASVFRVMRSQTQPLPKEETIFGRSLETLHQESSLPVPMLVLQAIGYLSRRTELEGIFRISAAHSHLMELKKLFKTPTDAIAFEAHTTDPHAVSSLLKLFLRELPISVIVPNVFKKFITLFKEEDIDSHNDETLKKFSDCLSDMPPCHLQTATMLFRFFNEVASKSEINLMTSTNLGIPLGPCVMRLEDPNPMIQIECWDSKITKFLLENHTQIFTPLMEKHDQQLEEQIQKKRVSVMMETLPSPINPVPPPPRTLSSGLSRRNLDSFTSPPSTTTTPLSQPPTMIAPPPPPPSLGASMIASTGTVTSTPTPTTNGFEFRVLGAEVGLCDMRVATYFFIKFTHNGNTHYIHRRYEDVFALDQDLRTTYGSITECPRKSSVVVFRESVMANLGSQIEQYLNWLNNLREVFYLRYFKEFIAIKDGEENAFAVCSISIRNSSGEMMGYLRANGSDVEISKEFERTAQFMWTMPRIKIRRPSSNDEFTYNGLRNVATQMFLYRSRLLSNAKFDSTFSERTAIDMSTPVWMICRGTFTESSPFYMNANNKQLLIASGQCDQPLNFTTQKIFRSTVEVSK
jgi:hypothetical protein